MNVRKRIIAYAMCYVMALAMLPVSVVGADVGAGGDAGETESMGKTADLETLTLSDEIALIPEFNVDTTKYTANVKNSVTNLSITATLADTVESGATLQIENNNNTESMASGEEKTVNLNNVGNNIFQITVTSRDTNKVYQITIVRAEEESPQTYTVTLNGNGGTKVTDLTEYTYGTGATLPVDWTRTGYNFKGWYDNEELNGDPVTEISDTETEDKKYWAKWEPVEYKIKYNLDGGEFPGNEENLDRYTIESEDITLKNPEKTGCKFTGWSGTGLTGNENQPVTIPKGSTGDREYTAHWSGETYTVTLNGNGGTGTLLTEYTYGTGATLPVDWTRTGYNFKGWYDNEELNGDPVTEISDTETEDKKYWAKWEPVEYKIKYNLDGGEFPGNEENLDRYTIESEDITLKNPEKTGCKFTGWSGTGLTGNENQPVTIPKGSTGDREYTAHWSGETYTVTLNGNGGTGTLLTEYTYGTGATLPVDWTRAGYEFAGWYVDQACVGSKVEKISVLETGNKTYWAKWIDNTAPVIGTLSYSYQPQNIKSWLIGKETLTITVPVTEEGSGADEISCTITSEPVLNALTPEAPLVQEKTAEIKNGFAELKVSADFKGTIVIACTDKAGNTSEETVISLIIEDNAPEIDFQVDGSEVSSDGYASPPEITVTVKDDKDSAVSGGLKSVTYQIGDYAEVSIEQDFKENLKSETEFSIEADQIPRGTTNIVVKAEDHAGNSFERTLPVHVHDGTLVEEEPATCKNDGHDAYYICECGRWFFDKEYMNEVQEKEDVKQSARGHSITTHMQPPTDTEEGILTYNCDVCKYVQERFVLPRKTMEIKLGQTATVISDASKCTFALVNAENYQNYLTLDSGTGEIRTDTKKLKNLKQIDKSADIQVKTAGMTYTVKASIQIPAPAVKIKTKKVGDRYRFTFKYNVKKLGAGKIKVVCNLKGLKKDVFQRYLSSPKSNKDSYVNLYLGKNKKVTFTITAYYGKKGKIASQKTEKTFVKIKQKLKEAE